MSTAIRNQESAPFAGGAITVATAEQLAELAGHGQGTVGQLVQVNGEKFGHCPGCPHEEDGQG